MLAQMFVTYGGRGWSTTKAPLQLADQERNIFALHLKLPVPLEELMAPKFWSSCKELKAGSRVEISMPSPTGRNYSFVLEVLRNVGATGAVMAPWPHVPPGLYEIQPHRTEEKPSNAPQIEHARAS